MPQRPSSKPAQFIQSAPVLEVTDLQRSVDFYVHNLGFICDFQLTDYAVVWRDNAALHFSKAQQAQLPVRLFHWLVDVDAYYAEIQQRGTKVSVAIGDREYGIRDFSVKDVNGFVLVFGQDSL